MNARPTASRTSKAISAVAFAALAFTTASALADWPIKFKKDCQQGGDCSGQSANCERLIVVCCCSKPTVAWTCMCSPEDNAECNNANGWTCQDQIQ